MKTKLVTFGPTAKLIVISTKTFHAINRLRVNRTDSLLQRVTIIWLTNWVYYTLVFHLNVANKKLSSGLTLRICELPLTVKRVLITYKCEGKF